MFEIRLLRLAACMLFVVVSFVPVVSAQELTASPAMNAERRKDRKDDNGRVREVRLALVCYGGSSLAIYMHGNTKEILRLVQASKALEMDAAEMLPEVVAGRRPSPGPVGRELEGSVRQWYDRLLDGWTQDPQYVRTRVVVDVIAGTSAGGINGVILAKALAHDLPIDALTELWLEKASLARLTNYYFGFLKVLGGGAPVDGKALVGWIHEALAGMDAVNGDRKRSLLPKGDRLDLFVTVTDRFGYPQNLIIGNPATAVEMRHGHMLNFVYSGVHRGCKPGDLRPGELDDFCPQWTPALAFAARATSSIPGVFPPLHLKETLDRLAESGPVGAAKADPDELRKRFFRNYQLQAKRSNVDSTYFVDGGVLDNHPFGPAIEAVLSRPQSQEVRRFLIYLQPDPEMQLSGPEPGRNPGLLKTVWAGLSGIPRGQPILENMNELERHQNAVARIQDLVRAEEQAAKKFEGKKLTAADCADLSRLPVAQRVACSLPESNGLRETVDQAQEQGQLRELRKRMEDVAENGFAEVAGSPERTALPAAALDPIGRSYINLRVHSVLAQFVTVISSSSACDYPEGSGHRALVARIIDRWARDTGLLDRVEDPKRLADLDLQKKFLEDFDVGYQRRQLRFVIDWIDGQYSETPPPDAAKRQVLDTLKTYAFNRVEDLTALIRGTSTHPDLPGQIGPIRELFCQLDPWSAATGESPSSLDRQARDFFDPKGHRKEKLEQLRRQLGAVMNRLQQEVRSLAFRNFIDTAQQLGEEEEQEILVRYLGFPFWDRQIYPYMAFSKAGELEKIAVFRLSPNDAILLGRRTADEVLKGAKLAHFGAFLSRKGREGDYLWGRLNAADRLLTVLDLGPEGARALFTSILDEEREAGLVRASILADKEKEIAKFLP